MNNAEIRATTSFQIPPEAKPFPRIVTENELNYKEFSQQPEYVQANRELISNFVKRLPDNFRHVDIATGTGLIPQLIIDEAIKENKTGIIFGIDPNVTSLNMAKINVRFFSI